MANKQPELLRDIITLVMDVLNQRRGVMCDYFDDFEGEFDGESMEDEFDEDDYEIEEPVDEEPDID